MNRLKWMWWGLTGKAQKLYIDANDAWSRACCNYLRLESEQYDIRHSLQRAQAAFIELQGQLPLDWEDKRKTESDALGETIMADMKANPGKYIP